MGSLIGLQEWLDSGAQMTNQEYLSVLLFPTRMLASYSNRLSLFG